MQTTECPLCGPMFIGKCVHGHAEPNEDHRQVMPQTVEAYKKLAQRDLELIEEQREEISKLKQRVNKLEQTSAVLPPPWGGVS